MTIHINSVNGDCRSGKILEARWLFWGSLGLLVGCSMATAQSPSLTNSMRGLLTTSGVNDEQWNQIKDRALMSNTDNRVLLQLLFRLPQVSLQSIENWALPVDFLKIGENPDACRGSIYRVVGRAVRVMAITVSTEKAEQWGLEKYYRLEIIMDESQTHVVVFARSIPHGWLGIATQGGVIDTPVVAEAVFLKLGPNVGETMVPIFVASSIAWHPSRPDLALGVTESHVLLARFGMDLRLLDGVRDRQGLVAEEREGFYQLLAAVSQVERSELFRRVKQDTELRQILDEQEYPQQRGELVALTGNAKRIVRIAIEAQDIRERLGIDHYYEINLFVDESVQLKRWVDDTEPMHYARYPVVCCARKLPPGMPEGDEINEAVRIAGFFFKLYAYETEFTNAQAGQPRQMSPLLITPEPVWYPRPSSSRSGWELVWGLGFVALVVTVWLVVWRLNRQDRRFKQTMLERKYQRSQEMPWDHVLPDPEPREVGPRQERSRGD